MFQRILRVNRGNDQGHERGVSVQDRHVPQLVHPAGEQVPGHVPHQVVPHPHDCPGAGQHEGGGDLAGDRGH